MRKNTPTLGGIRGGDGKKWHINAENGYPLESFCEKRFILSSHQGVADYIAQELDRVNLCDKCRKGWDRRNEMVTELNSMFNIPSANLRKAGEDVGFDSWLTQEQDDHLTAI